MIPARWLGLRARLFGVSLVLVGTFAATSGVWLAGRMREALVRDVEAALQACAAELAVTLPDDSGPSQLATSATRVAAAVQARVTLIDADGVVLADSEADPRTMDNHGARPEVRAALGPDGHGAAIRHSQTLDEDMLYVAVPWPRREGTGVVRMARALSVVEHEVAAFQRALWVAGIGGLVLTVVVAAAFIQLVTRDLLALTRRARALARPGGDAGADEIAWITGSIDRLARELRASVDEVAEERNRLHAVLAVMREAVIALDRSGRIHTTNPSARALLGADAALVGLPLVEAVRVPLLVDLVTRALDSGLPGTVELTWSGARDGEPRALLATATPQAGGGAVVVLHDLTELRRLEAVRRDFVANVSHELRTPVAVIQSIAEAMVDGALDDPKLAANFAAALHRHAERLGALISDLLDLARVEAGERALDRVPVRVATAVAATVEALAARAGAREQQVTVDVPDALEVLADPIALDQVLTNLVDNAIKYSPLGTSIAVRAEPLGESVRIEVADLGPGIPDGLQRRVFERFFRVDPGRSRDMGGTGLGLSIVRNLVEAMDGAVDVVANEPSGARFRVVLPTP